MNTRNDFLKKCFAIASFLLLSCAANAQLMWNLKGGFMGRKALVRESEVEEKNSPDWMVGLELEIPLSEQLNLETGLRYKDHKVFVQKEYNYDIGNGETFKRVFDANVNFEIPLRLTYKQPLGRHFSLHAGLGPYLTTCYGAGWDRYNAEYIGFSGSSIEWKDAKIGDMTNIGLETSVAINWACLSLGATYNNPCFYKGYKDENKPVVMATLGIRFKSSAWKYVGATLLSIVTFGGAAASAWSKAVEANRDYSSGSFDSYSSSGGSSSSTSGNANSNNLSEQQSYNTDKRTWDNYDSQLSAHFYGSRSATRTEVQQWQQSMKKLRQKWQAKGKSFPNSSNESKSTSNCSNSSHSH